MPWTQFMDMHSGGPQKEQFAYCYIEAPEDEAKRVFYARFGHNPDRVSCTCCGSDYSISEYESLEQATAYNRGLRFAMPVSREEMRTLGTEDRVAANNTSRYLEPDEDIPEGWHTDALISRPGAGVTLTAYLETVGDNVALIRAEDIDDNERSTGLPEQGYVWVD